MKKLKLWLDDVRVTGFEVVAREADGAGTVIGAAFDGNIHSLGGSYGFDISKNRMVAVDMRAIAHALDRIYGASRITQELSDGAKQ